MERAVQCPLPGFDDLTVHEQIEYVQALWERIAAREDEVPVPEWHKTELDRRLAEYETAPDAAERTADQGTSLFIKKLGRELGLRLYGDWSLTPDQPRAPARERAGIGGVPLRHDALATFRAPLVPSAFKGGHRLDEALACDWSTPPPSRPG